MDSNLKTELTADASQASNELKRFGNELTQFEKKAASFNRLGASRGYGQEGARMMEFARGLEDFTVGFQTGGLSGALRGATNNAATFAATLGPMAALYTTIASVGAMILIPHLERLMSSFDDSEKQAKKFKETLENLEKIRAFSGMRAKLELDVEFFAEGLKDKLKTASAETIKDMRDALDRQMRSNALELNTAIRGSVIPLPEVAVPVGSSLGADEFKRVTPSLSRKLLRSMFPDVPDALLEDMAKRGEGGSARIGAMPTKAELEAEIKKLRGTESELSVGTARGVGTIEHSRRLAGARASRLAAEEELKVYDKIEAAQKKINELILMRDKIQKTQAILNKAPIPLQSPVVQGDMRFGSQGMFDVLDRLLDPTPKTDEQVSVLRQMLTNLEESKHVLTGIKDEVAKRVAVGRLN